MAKRKNGEGTWGKKTIKGIEYFYYRNTEGKYFYGKTEKDVRMKIKLEKEDKIDNKSTFGEYMLWYYENIHKNTVEKSTYTSYRTILKNILNSKYYDLGCMQMGSFDPINNNYVQQYINKITPHYALNTIKGQWNVIRVGLIYAEENNMIYKGICNSVKLPKEANCKHNAKVVPFLSKSDSDALCKEINTCYKSTGKKRYSSSGWVVLLLIHTGLRVGEMSALRWNDIDFKNKTLRVDESIGNYKEDFDEPVYNKYSKDPKNYTSKRIIPLDSIAIEMLRNFEKLNPHYKENDFVCISYREKKPISYKTIYRTADLMLNRIGSEVTHISPHALRHTFGSILYEQGVPLKTISKLMGHKNISTTANIYVGINIDTLTNAIEKLEPENNN